MAHHHRDLRIHFRFHFALASLFVTCSLLHPAALRPLREELHPELVGIVPDDLAGAGEKNNAAFNFLRLAPRRTSSTASATPVTEPTTMDKGSPPPFQSPTATVTAGVEVTVTTSLDKITAEDSAQKQPEVKISQVSSSVSVSMSKSVQMATVASLGGNLPANKNPNILQQLPPPSVHLMVSPDALISTDTLPSTTTNTQRPITASLATNDQPPTTQSNSRRQIIHSNNHYAFIDDISDSIESDQDQLAKIRSASEETHSSTTLAPATSTSTSTESQNDVGKILPSASAEALLGRKIVGFVNLPRMYLTASGSAATNGVDSASSLAGPLETDTHYVYGPIKDVRDTLEAYGVPRPETWLLDPQASTQRPSDTTSSTSASTTLSMMAPLVADATIFEHASNVAVEERSEENSTEQFTILEYDNEGIADATLIPPMKDEEVPAELPAAGPAALIQEEIPSNYEGAPSNHVPIAQEKDSMASLSKSSSSLKVAPNKVESPIHDDEEDDEEEDQQIFMIDEDDGRKYRVEEKTPDGYIVGEYGVISRDSGHLRGVRYTAHAGSANSELIQQALMRFLSL